MQYLCIWLHRIWSWMKFENTVWNRVSNGTGQCNFSGQQDRQNFFVPGQRNNGTEVPSLSWNKGTMGQAQNPATGRDGPEFWQAVSSRPGTSNGTEVKEKLLKKGDFYFFSDYFEIATTIICNGFQNGFLNGFQTLRASEALQKPSGQK